MTREDRINALISLDDKINKELAGLQSSIDEISKYVSNEDGHAQYLSRISFIQALFDRASDVIRDISLTDSDTNFYEALNAKTRISENYVRFGRMQNEVERAFNKELQSETDFMERRIGPASEIVDELPEEEEDLTSTLEEDSEDFPLDEQLIEEEEKAAKKKAQQKKKIAAEQKALSTAEQERQRRLDDDRRYQENQQRLENERRQAEIDTMRRDDENRLYAEDQHRQADTDNIYRDNDYSDSGRIEKPITAADLRDEQYREGEKRAAEEAEARARRQETHEKFLAYQDEHRPDMPIPENNSQSNSPSYSAPFNHPDEHRSGEHRPDEHRPEKPVTAADLRDEQYREEEKRASEQEETRARRQETHDRFTAYQETHRPSDRLDNNDSYSKKDAPSSVPGYKPHQEPERASVSSERTQTVQSTQSNPTAQPNQFSTEKPHRHTMYAFTPSGIASVNPTHPQTNYAPCNGAYQGFHLQPPTQNRTPAPDRGKVSPPLSSGSRPGYNNKPSEHLRPVSTAPSRTFPIKPSSPPGSSPSRTSSLKTSASGLSSGGGGRKSARPQSGFVHFGYTPTGVYAHTSVNGVLSSSQMEYKTKSKSKSSDLALSSSIKKGRNSDGGDKKRTDVMSFTRSRGSDPRRSRGPVYGATVQPKSKRENVNKIQKSSLKEPGSGLTKKSRHLRTKAIAATYAKAIGKKTVRFTGDMAALGLRKLYSVLQEGENNGLRGFETSRYYGMSAVRASKALAQRNKPRKLIEKFQGEKFKNNREAKKFIKKDIAKEIEDLKVQGKKLKKQIKALQSKGSALTAAERQKLKNLMDEHKSLHKKKKLFGKARKKALKNTAAISGGLGALKNSLMSALQKSDESGVQGLARALNLATNRRVHVLVKSSLRATWMATKFTARTTGKVANVTGKGAKVVIKATGKGAKVVAKTTGKGVKVAANLTGKGAKVAAKATVITVNKAGSLVKTGHTAAKTVARLAPKKIKTLSLVGKKMLKKPHAAGAKKLFLSSSKGVSKFFSAGLKGGIKVLSMLFKGAAIKVLAFCLPFLMIIGAIIGAVMAGGAGGSSSSMILAPMSDALGMIENAKIDLSPYCNIVTDEWNDYVDDIERQADNENADKVVINMGTAPENTREILSMMAVRMRQDLNLAENSDVEPYLRYLVRQLNPVTKTESKYSCSGCETKTVNGKTKTYCPGNHKMITYNISAMHFGPAEQVGDSIFSADEMANENQEAVQGSLIGKFEITYYAPTGNPTASGTIPKAGRTIAVDPGIIPLGTHVIIYGHEYVAEDTGGVIQGNIIDIFVSSEEEALQKGRRYNVPVYNVTYEGENYQESDEWNGWTDENQQWAKNIYYQNWNELYKGFDGYVGGVVDGGDIIVSGDWVWPVTTTSQSSGYGWRIHPIYGTRKFHKGTDIAIPVGTPVYAAAAGTVAASGDGGTAGIRVNIQHADSVMTKYFHLSQTCVSAGQQVEAGQLIAYSGNTGASTGPHLHFEFWVGGATVDPRAQYGFTK